MQALWFWHPWFNIENLYIFCLLFLYEFFSLIFIHILKDNFFFFFFFFFFLYSQTISPFYMRTFFVWALLLIVHTWNSSPLRSNLLRLQCTCSTVPTTSARPHGSPLVWACQWPLSQPLSSPQLSHNDSLSA